MKHDEKQSDVILFRGGRALVLGAPGCGKTRILGQRVQEAHRQYGIPYSEMLCITFTNRASREMKDRIALTVGPEALGELFVGNLHRFCLRFLYDNEIVPLDANLIDDIDQGEILEEISGKYKLYLSEINAVYGYAAIDFMVSNGFPPAMAASRKIDPRADLDQMQRRTGAE